MGAEASGGGVVRILAGDPASPPDGGLEDLTLQVARDDPRSFHRTLPAYRPTPLVSRPDLAARAGVAEVLVKDEAHRFGLGSFKALGASYAVGTALRNEETRSGTVCTATEGNHGRAVAWAARSHGLACRVFLPDDTDPRRIEAIRSEGAFVEEVPGDYEEAVERARRAAERDGWLLVQDTAWEGYTEIPLRIMKGYTTALREVEGDSGPDAEPHGEPPADVVFLQAGVGSWAGAAAAYLHARWGPSAPRVAVVEPTAAACILESAEAGGPVEAGGGRNTAMNGLNCGVPSTLGHRILGRLARVFVAVDDGWAHAAVEALSRGDPPVPSAPAGAAGLAGLLALSEGRGEHGEPRRTGDGSGLEEARRALGLGEASRVLVVNTEGPPA